MSFRVSPPSSTSTRPIAYSLLMLTQGMEGRGKRRERRERRVSYFINILFISIRYVVESSTYHTNITAANLQDNPEWVWEYNATSTYGMTSLFPSDWAALTDRFDADDDLFQLFYMYVSPPKPLRLPLHFSFIILFLFLFESKKKQQTKTVN